MWASTVSITPAKNQRTTGRRSTGQTLARGCAWTAAGSAASGSRQAAQASSTNRPKVNSGNAPMPVRCSTTPKASTDTMKPIAPQTRTRP